MTERELGILAEHFSGDGLEEAERRVEEGEPLAYVIGEWYFYGLTFKLNGDCLVPRPDTEHVVDRAIELIPSGGRFVDLGCGSGCIALSVLHERHDCTALLCDISRGALDMARHNARALGIADRADFIEADMRVDLPPEFGSFDAIISNPPYIDSGVVPTLSPQVRREPRIALDGGPDGLDFYRTIFAVQAPRLAPGGSLILEIGYDQASRVCDLAAEHGFDCRIFRDYGGNDRVAVCKRP